MILRVRNRFVIALAWGPRRVSSKAYGRGVSPYPTEVAASWRLWAIWLRDGLLRHLRRETQIVIVPHRARARTQAAITDVEPPELQAPPALHPDEIARIQAERQRLREARRFAEADALRDHLIAHGVTVADAAQKEQEK